jgi:hypothetical protein
MLKKPGLEKKPVHNDWSIGSAPLFLSSIYLKLLFFMTRPTLNVAGRFSNISKPDALVKSPPNRHTGESRYPKLLKNTGFRVKPGMTKEANYDF